LLFIAVNTPLVKFRMVLFANTILQLFLETLAQKFVEMVDDLGQMISGTIKMRISAMMEIRDQEMDAVKIASLRLVGCAMEGTLQILIAAMRYVGMGGSSIMIEDIVTMETIRMAMGVAVSAELNQE